MELGLKRHSRAIALEMIDLQDSSFGEQLESVVSDIKLKIDNKTFDNYNQLIDSGIPKDIEAMIFKRTGLKVQLIVNADIAAILSFFANKHHIFLNPLWRGNFTLKDQQAILDSAHGKKGFVDIKKAKVGGLFSEYKNLLYINFHILVNQYKLSSREIVAIILHELGHAFYNCEYSDRLESTNQVLANVAKEMLSQKPEKNLEYIYKELKSINENVNDQDVDAIVNGSKVIAGYKLFKLITGSVIGQMTDSTYDKTAFEQMADHFASKFGYGRELITALDKLHDYFANPEKSQTYNIFNTLMTSVAFLAMTIGFTAIIVAAPAAIALISTFYIWLIMFIAREDVQDYTYDKLKLRYKRIRNNYIDTIKKADLPVEELKLILSNVYFIDEIISNTNIPVNAFNKVSNLLFSKAKKADAHIREQQLMEELAFNDIFLKSAEFNTIQ